MHFPWEIPRVLLDLSEPTHPGACWVLCSPLGCAGFRGKSLGKAALPGDVQFLAGWKIRAV